MKCTNGFYKRSSVAETDCYMGINYESAEKVSLRLSKFSGEGDLRVEMLDWEARKFAMDLLAYLDRLRGLDSPPKKL